MRLNACAFAVLVPALIGTAPAFAAKPPPKPPANTFSVQNGSGSEAAQGASVNVTRTTGKGTASVSITTTDGSATAGSDYDALTTVVNFARNETSKTVHFNVIDDSVAEPAETFNVELFGASRGYGYGTSGATVSLADDDKPATPTGLGLTAPSYAEVDVSWDSAPDHVTSWELYRRTGSGTAVNIATIAAGDGPTYTDTGVQPGTTYYYELRATNASGDSADTSEVAITTPSPALPDTLEGETRGWTATGFWHLTDGSACGAPPGWPSGNHAFWFGSESSCSYLSEDGSGAGSLTSPDYPINGDEDTLSLNYYLDTEGDNQCIDTTTIEVSYDHGSTWHTLYTCPPETSTWSPASLPIDPQGSTSLTVRFTFSIGDTSLKSFPGWYVDDIDASKSASP